MTPFIRITYLTGESVMMPPHEGRYEYCDTLTELSERTMYELKTLATARELALMGAARQGYARQLAWKESCLSGFFPIKELADDVNCRCNEN